MQIAPSRRQALRQYCWRVAAGGRYFRPQTKDMVDDRKLTAQAAPHPEMLPLDNSIASDACHAVSLAYHRHLDSQVLPTPTERFKNATRPLTGGLQKHPSRCIGRAPRQTEVGAR